MTLPSRALTEGDLVADAWELMLAGDQHHLLVVRHGRPIGILSAGDLGQLGHMPTLVGAVLRRSSAVARPETPIAEVHEVMVERGLLAMPVVGADGAAVGLVTLLDVVRARADGMEVLMRDGGHQGVDLSVGRLGAIRR